MEASLCRSTFFIAASSPTLSFSVAFDIAGVASRHVKRVLRVSAWRARSRIKRGGISRAISDLGGDDEEEGALRDMQNRKQGVVGFWSFDPSSQAWERFRSSPLPDFDDEFIARMMAMEASRLLSSSRACSTFAASTFFEASTLCAGCEPPRPSHGQGVESAERSSGGQIGVLAMGGVQLPSSIKKLRRRKSSEATSSESAMVRSVRESGCAIKRAFSSMLYMIKAMQSHALQIRQALFCDKWDVQQVLYLVDREMHSSFVWLFQRVFACTPTLMVSVMILLANFTVFSMGENVAAVTATVTPPFILFPYPQAPPYSSPTTFSSVISMDQSPLFPLPASGYGGNINFPSAPTAQGFDGDSRWLNSRFEPNRAYGFPEVEPSMAPSLNHSPLKEQGRIVEAGDHRPSSHREMVRAWVESTMKNQMQLEQETTQRLVAPVVAHLESDNYACFDRTDLEYQLAVSKDPTSAVLLSNYAQFLFVVRRDNDRAEQYFHRAIEADPQDSSILGRFASFLWLGRGNRSAAERAYKAAMVAAPESSYPAGSYAHFLWHASEENL